MTDSLIFLFPIVVVVLFLVMAVSSTRGRADSQARLLQGLGSLFMWFVSSNKPRIEEEFESHDEKIDRWETIADRLGLERVDNYPKTRLEMRGTIDGVDVEVRRESNAEGNTMTRYEVDLAGLVPEQFALEPQTTPEYVTGLGVMNREDIHVGHEKLDRAFVFHGVGKEEVREFMWQEGVEACFERLVDFPAGTRIEEGRLRIVEPGRAPSAEDGIETVERAVEFAVELRRALEGGDEAEPTVSGEGWEAPS